MVKHVGIDELLVDREYDSSVWGGNPSLVLVGRSLQAACGGLVGLGGAKEKKKKEKKQSRDRCLLWAFSIEIVQKKAKSMA